MIQTVRAIARAVALVLLALPALAFADTAPPAPAPSLFGQLVSTLAPAFMPMLGTLITAGLAFLGAKVATLITAHVHSSYLQAALLRLNEVVQSVVRELEQTVIGDLRDGSLPAGAAWKAKADAIAKVKSYLGPTGLGLLGRVLGLSPDAFDGFIASKIEAAVHDMKAAAPVAVAPVVSVDPIVVRTPAPAPVPAAPAAPAAA